MKSKDITKLYERFIAHFLKADENLTKLSTYISKAFDWVDEPVQIVPDDGVVWVVASRGGNQFKLNFEDFVNHFGDKKSVDIEEFINLTKI